MSGVGVTGVKVVSFQRVKQISRFDRIRYAWYRWIVGSSGGYAISLSFFVDGHVADPSTGRSGTCLSSHLRLSTVRE